MKARNKWGVFFLLSMLTVLLCACSDRPSELSFKDGDTEVPTQAENGSSIIYKENGSGQNITLLESVESEVMSKSSDRDTLVIGAYGENYVTSTLATVGYNNVIAISLIYDTLFAKNFETGEIEGRLAESYNFQETDDGVVLHIKIREGAAFQSGEKITAEDCFYATAGRVNTVGVVRTYLGKTIDAEHSWYEGDRDLYLKLYQYDSTILETLSCQWLNIGNKSFENQATDDDYWDAVDGSGPFIIESQVSGESMTLKVDDNYWGWDIVQERPSYDYLYVKIYSEASVMLIDYEKGALDACLGLSVNDTRRVLNEGMPYSNLKIVSSGNYTVIALPSYNPVFNDIRVREAMFCAIDTETAAEVAYGELGEGMASYVSSMANYRKSYDTNRYDPERAKALLEEAGYHKGDIKLKTVVSSNDASSMVLAEVVQGYLAEVGIELTIESYAFPIAIQLQRNGSVDLCMTTFYTMNGDISGCFVQLIEGSYNKAAWLTQLEPELLTKLNEGRYTSSTETSTASYQWVQDWLDKEAWYMPVVEYNTALLYRDYVNADTFNNLMHARDIRNLNFVTP